MGGAASTTLLSAAGATRASLTDFGGVGDGVTLNTDAFRTAVDFLSGFAPEGGSMLYVPPGKWLTGSFNLTSHFTLFLDQDAVILASQDENDYPVIEPLPSYGRGRDTEGGRFISLIFGTNLTDVVITGNNGTLDGQGKLWWDKFHNGTLNYTRPYLIEIMYSENIQISNITLLNSPSWNVHPVYSSDIIIEGITIIAPTRSPNTDGINPDSCTNTRIQDCYIVSGDDCIAVKSGWDEYGIAFGMPTKQLVIRRVTCISPTSAMIALGSEMSGGIEDVRAEDIVAIDTESAVRIKTGVGRGGYVKDIYVRRVTMKTMKYVFWMTGNYGSHPDDKYDPNAFPVIENINYRDMVAENVTMAGRLEGISGDPFTGICISNVTIEMGQHAKILPWNCTDISGVSSGVVPQPCGLLPDQGPDKVTSCDFPAETLPIENVEVQTCACRQKLRMEEANAAEQSPNQQAGNTQAAKKMNVPGHFGSEKYGSWMLVSRKERRNKNRRMNPSGEAPSSFNRQDTRRNIGPEELGTQSRFAALENLDDEPGQDQEMVGAMSPQQPENFLPRIRTNERNIPRSPMQGDGSTHQERRSLDQGNQNQPAFYKGYQNSERSGYHQVHRGGQNNTNRGGVQNVSRGGYQATFRGGFQGAYRGNHQVINYASRGHNRRGGMPNRAAAEAEHTVVRGSNRGGMITSTVVNHTHEQPNYAAMTEFENSPKEHPPDQGRDGSDEFNFPDIAMEEGDGQCDLVDGVAVGHLRS
nr:probable polygalacturonase [Ipomoea batatas]